MNKQTETMETPEIPFSSLEDELKRKLLDLMYFFLLVHKPGALKHLPGFSSMRTIERIRALVSGGKEYFYLKLFN